jgi:hypothetical protein
MYLPSRTIIKNKISYKKKNKKSLGESPTSVLPSLKFQFQPSGKIRSYTTIKFEPIDPTTSISSMYPVSPAFLVKTMGPSSTWYHCQPLLRLLFPQNNTFSSYYFVMPDSPYFIIGYYKLKDIA